MIKFYLFSDWKNALRAVTLAVSFGDLVSAMIAYLPQHQQKVDLVRVLNDHLVADLVLAVV